ncbi:MAG: hypothetical protein P4L50_20910 [Anaerolineaceae bacterium]|nr:hypothetical protein [Anaerolineaceae bacterium]
MRKSLLTTFILLFVMVSCNYPQARRTPTPDLLATAVAATITARPSSTPKPTVTAIPPRPTGTATALPSPTTTITITPTLASSDPRSTLGTPTYKNTNFSKGWYMEDDEHTHITVSDSGALVLTSLQPIGWHSWSMYYHSLQNFYLEATLHTDTCSGSDRYGLVFRAPDNNHGYFFGLSCDGQYNLSSYDGTNFTTIVDYTKFGAILSGSNQTNRVGVMARGSEIDLYVNGVSIKQINDPTYPAAGVFGVFIASQVTANFTYEMDEIDYWILP